MKRGTLSSQPWFYPAVAFAAHSGARRGEMLAVEWSDLDRDERTVTIRESLSEPKSGLVIKRPKNDKTRTIVIGPELVAIVRTHQAMQAAEHIVLDEAYRGSKLVFARPNGTPVAPWNFGAAFKDLVARAGVMPINIARLA